MAAEEPDDDSTLDSELSEDDLEFVGALVTAFNLGDLEAYLQLFDPSAIATTSLTFGSDLDQYRQELAFVWALNGTWEMGDCEIEYGAISCEIAVSRDDLTFIEGPLSAKLDLFVEDGAVRKLTLREPHSTIVASTTAFHDWVAENYAESVPAMFFDFPSGLGPELSEESIALWVELVPQYIESVTE
jgi:hypothetical protein